MERRRSPRVAISEDGAIVYGLSKAARCVIQNISGQGACLEIEAPLDPVIIPPEFVLYRPSARSMRNCRVVWRSFQRLGVEFK